MRPTIQSLLANAIIVGALLLHAGPVLAHGPTHGEGLRLSGANPFHREASVSFRISHAMAKVDLSVFDVAGRQVAQVFHGSLGPGEHHYTISAKGLSKGIYMARLVTEHGTYVKRITFE